MEEPRLDIESALEKLNKRIKILEDEFYKPDNAEMEENQNNKIEAKYLMQILDYGDASETYMNVTNRLNELGYSDNLLKELKYGTK